MVNRYNWPLQIEVTEILTGHMILLAIGHGLLPMPSVLQSEVHSTYLLRTFLLRSLTYQRSNNHESISGVLFYFFSRLKSKYNCIIEV